jgi:hypothetical protein
MDGVTRSTKWGSALVGRPGVNVVSIIGQLEQFIDRIINARDSLRRALRSLAG